MRLAVALCDTCDFAVQLLHVRRGKPATYGRPLSLGLLSNSSCLCRSTLQSRVALLYALGFVLVIIVLISTSLHWKLALASHQESILLSASNRHTAWPGADFPRSLQKHPIFYHNFAVRCHSGKNAGREQRFGGRLVGLMGKPSVQWWECLQTTKCGAKLLHGISAKLAVVSGRSRQNKYKIAWEVVGPGAGPPSAVVTPAGYLSRDAARRVASALAREGHMRVLIWDRRGTGASSVWAPMTESTIPEQEVTDLVTLLDKLGAITPLLLVGFSAGARLSALFALKHPTRVASLIILPTGDAGGATAKLACVYFGDCAEVVDYGGMEALLASRGNHFYDLARRSRSAYDDLLAASTEEFVAVLRRSESFLKSFVGEHFSGLHTAQFQELSMPVLVVHHALTDDRIHAVEDARAVARLLPNAEIVLTDDIEALEHSMAEFAIRTVQQA